MGVGLGIAAGGLAAAGGNICAGMSAAKAQKEAAAQNAAAAAAADRLRYQMWRESRGSEGSAILPIYQRDQELKLAEDARNIYDATGVIAGTPEEQALLYKAIVDAERPTFNAGTRVLRSIYDGGFTEERLANAAPVMAARTQAADASMQGIFDSLARIKAAQAARRGKAGYVGGGTFATNRLLATEASGRQAAAQAKAQAILQNAEDARTIRDQTKNLQLSSLDAVANRAKQRMDFERIPIEGVGATYAARTAPFQFFRIGPGAPAQVQGAPMVSAVPKAGQYIGSAISGLGQTAANYFANKALIDQMNKNPGANKTFTVEDYIKMYGTGGSGGVLGTPVTDYGDYAYFDGY